MSNNTKTAKVLTAEDMLKTNKRLDLPVGTEIDYFGTRLVVKADELYKERVAPRPCHGCYFLGTMMCIASPWCLPADRADKTPVIFAEKEGGENE